MRRRELAERVASSLHLKFTGVFAGMPSSVIAAMSYNTETRILTIVYRGKRGTYHYFEVPPEEYQAFRAAPSKGVYLNEIFKPKEYRYERKQSSD
jgi:hypothetical protein